MMPHISSNNAQKNYGQSAVALAAASFSWGFIIIKSIDLVPSSVAFWRLLGGAILITVIALLFSSSWKELRSPLIIIAGLAFGAHQLLYIAAAKLTSISIVTTLGATLPLWVTLLSSKFINERVPTLYYLFSLLAIAGVALIVTVNQGTHGHSWIGNGLAFINVLAFAAYFFAAKRLRMKKAETLPLTGSCLIIAMAVVVPAMVFFSESSRVTPSQNEAILLAILVVGPANGHLLLNWAHAKVSAAFSSLCLSLVPLLASIWALLILGEPFTWVHLLGMLLVMLGIEGGRRLENKDHG